MLDEATALRIANDDADAARFLRAFVAHCHMLDDVIDRDAVVDDERLIQSEAAMLLQMGNPFFQKHATLLIPLIINGYNAWLDANRMEKSPDENVARAADVVKGFYHEVCWQVAFICGGWAHMRNVTRTLREYDYDYGMLRQQSTNT
jgi:hypothetical protein